MSPFHDSQLYAAGKKTVSWSHIGIVTLTLNLKIVCSIWRTITHIVTFIHNSYTWLFHHNIILLPCNSHSVNLTSQILIFQHFPHKYNVYTKNVKLLCAHNNTIADMNQKHVLWHYIRSRASRPPVPQFWNSSLSWLVSISGIFL